MTMWSMKVITLLLFCYACLSTGSERVYFVSRNFNNTLHWNAAKPAFPGENATYMYSVQYRSDAGEQTFQKKEQCQNIIALYCDLTDETPSVHDVHYSARVFVNGRLHGKTYTRFTPIAHTTLGPPILSTHTTVSSLHVNVTLPLGPDGVSIADIIANSTNGPFKSEIVYILKITHPEWAAQVNVATTGQFIINLKNNQTEYCGHVVYKPSTEWGRAESENSSFCVTLPGDPLMFLPWILITAGLLAVVVVVPAVWVCNYVRGGKAKSFPKQLVTASSTPPRILQSLDKNLIISTAAFCSPSDQTVYATIQVKPNVSLVGVGGYSPQDIPRKAWPASSGSSVVTDAHSPSPNPEDVSAQSSEIYSELTIQVPAEGRDFQQAIKDRESCDKGGRSAKLTSQEAPLLPALDPFEGDPARKLLLHTARDLNGQLVLPSLTFQFQSSAEDTRRTLLLSDLIDSRREGPSLASLQSSDGSDWSDSERDDSTLNSPVKSYCGTHYRPAQLAVSYLQQGCQITPSGDAPEAGYKQSWMPAILPRPSSKDMADYSWAWTGLKKDEESEEEEHRREEGARETLLGGWMLQIQE